MGQILRSTERILLMSNDKYKKRKEREGTKSHKIIIFHVFIEKPPVNRLLKNLHSQRYGCIFNGANFCVDKGLWLHGVRNLPLKQGCQPSRISASVPRPGLSLPGM